MKISVFKDDEGYENYLTHRPIMIYVNGEPLSNVVRLDTDEGWAEFNLKDAEGLFVIEDGEIVTDLAEGLIEVEGNGLPRVPADPVEPEEPIEPEDDEDA